MADGNEVSRRKIIVRAKVKVASQDEQIHQWKQHFENLFGKPSKVKEETITKIISNQVDIKLSQFTQELYSVLRKIKNRKAAGLDETPAEVGKTRKFDDLLLQHCKALYSQNKIDRWTRGFFRPFPKKIDLGLAKNYRGMTFISTAANIYNALLRNRIKAKTENILRKNRNGFWRNNFDYPSNSRRCTFKKLWGNNITRRLLRAFYSINRGKIEQIFLAFGLPKETVASIMML